MANVAPTTAVLVTPRSPSRPGTFVRLLPISSAVLVGFLTIGLALPVLPLYVSGTLGFGSFVVGILMGCQFATALISRAWAGAHADTRGAKHAVITGFVLASLSGIVYLISLLFPRHPLTAVGVLLLGRVVLGYGESLVVTGALGWGIGLVGAGNAGKVMAWVGVAIYAALAAGAPAGTAIYDHGGFAAIALATLLIPMLAILVVLPVPPVASPAALRVPFHKVVAAVWLPGLGLTFASIGFGTVTAFIALHFAAFGWGNASLAISSFGVAFIVARLFFGGRPDRHGGAKVALICVLIEAVGQLLIWYGTSRAVAFCGSALTGFGYSLAFPAFGVEAVRRAPPQSRAVAMGAYVAFMDLGLGIAGPTLGFIASRWDVRSVYLAGTGLVLCSSAVAAALLMDRSATRLVR